MDSKSLTPKVIKEELDRYVIGQDEAKKSSRHSTQKSVEKVKYKR